MSHGQGCRHSSDLMWLWLQPRLTTVAPIRPLAWEPPYAAGAAQEIATTTTTTKRQKKKKKKKKERDRGVPIVAQWKQSDWDPGGRRVHPWPHSVG